MWWHMPAATMLAWHGFGNSTVRLPDSIDASVRVAMTTDDDGAKAPLHVFDWRLADSGGSCL